MIKPAAAPIAGARTAWPASPTTSNGSASHSPFGTARIPILKERLFGLTNSESNHGEDVKEYYFYLDSTPTHSYMKYLYKYPQAPFPTQASLTPARAAAVMSSSMSCSTPASSTRIGISTCSSNTPRTLPKTS